MRATLKRRVKQLEERSGVGSGKPRKVHRIVVGNLDSEPSIANAECSRTLYPGGTLIEIVDLNNTGDAHEVLSDEALDRFVESFPVKVLV
jgi:hypothetical protein